MKMRLMTFDEAYEACSRKYPTKIGFSKEYVFGKSKENRNVKRIIKKGFNYVCKNKC